jgi:hypothetical protein
VTAQKDSPGPNACHVCGLSYRDHCRRNADRLVQPGSAAAARHEFRTIVGAYKRPKYRGGA